MADRADPRSLDALVQALDDEAWAVRAGAATAIGKVYYHNKGLDPARVLPQLISLLDAEEVGLRISTLHALTWIRDRAATGVIRATLGDEDDRVRSATIKALGALRDEASVGSFVGILQNHSDLWTRYDAACALGHIGSPQAVEPLLAALGDPAGQVRRAVIGALGELGDPRAIEPLIRHLRDRDPEARYRAIMALVKFGDKRALIELERMAQDDHEMGNGERLSIVATGAIKHIHKKHRKPLFARIFGR